MVRVLVTGASGLLGRAVFSRLESSGHQLLGTAYSRDHGGKFKLLDLCDFDATKRVVTDFNPEAVIHCAAERRPDAMEQNLEKSRFLNVSSTRNLAEIALSIDAWFLYISSDYVFDGKQPPFYENDKSTNPLNKYGQSKLDGEVECLAVSEKSSILRVPVLYGHVESLDESAVTILLKNLLKTDQKCVMSDYERRYPTHVGDIAIVIDQMLEKRKDLQGYFHFSGEEEMTKYDMSMIMCRLFNLPTDHVAADKNPSGGAKRPYNAKLDCQRLKALGIGHQTRFEDGIKEFLEPWAKQTKISVKIHTD